MLNYLLELIKTNNRVIIPDFGAFIVKQGSKRLVVFNEFLKYNDGLLIEFVAQKENISKPDSQNKVESYVKELKAKLKADKVFVLNDFGTLKINELGKITFIQKDSGDSSEEATTDNIKAPVTESKPDQPVSKTTEPKSADKPESKPTGESKQKTETKSETKKEETPKVAEPKKDTAKGESDKKTEEKKVAPAAATAKTEKTEVKKETPVTSKSTSQSTTQTKTESKKPEAKAYGYNNQASTYNTGTNDRNPKKIVQNTIIVIVLSGLVAFLVYVAVDLLFGVDSKKDKTVLKAEKAKTEEVTYAVETQPKETAAPVDAEKKDSEKKIVNQIEKELKTRNAQTKQVVKSSNNRYYIVAGCFAIENNANNLVTKLRNEGFKAEKFGKIGELHAVSFESFNSKGDALVALKDIRNQTGEKAWLYINK